MTRLVPDMIDSVPSTMDELDRKLLRLTGGDLVDLACDTAGISRIEMERRCLRVGIVPLTSGQGVISGFSESLEAIALHLGLDAFVADCPDVCGMAQAVDLGADVVMMSDDDTFIALNLAERRFSENSHATALGYCTALERAADGLRGREVAVIGAGPVGSAAAERLMERGASIVLVERDMVRAQMLAERFSAIRLGDIQEELECADLVLNASPAVIPGRFLREGCIVSSPGVPYSFDEEAERKARIIHDPLQTGVAVMLAECVAFSAERAKAFFSMKISETKEVAQDG